MINKNAPVQSRAEITINAPIQTVWQLACDIDRWPDWNPDITWTQLEGSLNLGTRFVADAGPGATTFTIVALKPNRLIAWSGKMLNIRVTQTWQVHAVNKKTIARAEASWDGLLARLLRSFCQKTADRGVVSWLQYLKIAAEEDP